jgi:hypothetical protein
MPSMLKGTARDNDRQRTLRPLFAVRGASRTHRHPRVWAFDLLGDPLRLLRFSLDAHRLFRGVSKVTPLELVLERLEDARGAGDKRTARCSAHDDRHASLSITERADGAVLLHCFAGCPPEEIVAAIGLEMRDLFPSENGAREHRARVTATYDYRDENDALLFQVVRYHPKDFRQRRPAGKGAWIWNLKDTRRVPYRLPELVAADRKRWVRRGRGEALARSRGRSLSRTSNFSQTHAGRVDAAQGGEVGEAMFGDGFEQSTILRTAPDRLTRVITRSSWAERQSVLVEAREAELLVFRRWEEFHREALGFMPSWDSRAC